MCACKVESSEVCAIMTTFEPEPSILDRVSKIREQVGRLILVNDSGSEKVKNLLNEWLLGTDKVSLIHNIENLGIAYSLNVGIQLAKKHDYKWLLTLDDDSRLNDNFVTRLLQNQEHAMLHYNVGLISLSREESRYPSAPRFEIKRGVITSGSLIDVNIYDLVGGFREELFIDLVDYEFCLRIRRLGYVVLKSSEFGMIHPVGSSTIHKILGLEFSTYNHPPFRRYYISRNSIVLARENLINDPAFSLVLLFDVFLTFIKVVLFERDKAEKVSCMMKGVAHGLLSRMGRVTPP